MDNDLFAHVRRSDPNTSKQAAQSVDVERLQGEILRMLKGQESFWSESTSCGHPTPGLTTSEIAENMGVARDSISPRMTGLVERGLIENSGIRRAGPSGRASIVWALKK